MGDMARRLPVVVAILWMAATVTAAPSMAAGDPLAGLQWSLRTIGADPAGPFTGSGVTVAVIDTGVQADHEDLAGGVGASVDCIGAAGDPSACRPHSGDEDGHGTHVAGIVGARAGNDKGIVGVAPTVTLQSVKVLERGCEDAAVGGVVCGAVGDSSDVEAGIRWATAAGADVINLSVADDAVQRMASGSPLVPAIEAAWQAGVVVVVAAGNDLDVASGSGYDDIPAIVVAATGPDDVKASYSNSVGTARWGMAAPGGDDDGACPTHAILSTWVQTQPPNEDYACMDGTSMAAPHVAGAIAVLLSAGFAPHDAVQQLLRTAVDLGEEGTDGIYGAGRLDLAAALAAPPPAVPPPPPAPSSPQAAASSAEAAPAPVPTEPAEPVPTASAPIPPSSAPTEPVPGSVPPPRSAVGRIERPGSPDVLPRWLVALGAASVLANFAGVVTVRRRTEQARRAATRP